MKRALGLVPLIWLESRVVSTTPDFRGIACRKIGVFASVLFSLVSQPERAPYPNNTYDEALPSRPFNEKVNQWLTRPEKMQFLDMHVAGMRRNGIKGVFMTDDQAKRRRKTVELPVKLDSAITEMADELGISVSELLRRAADRLVKEEEKRRDGYQVGAFKESEDGRIERAYLYDL